METTLPNNNIVRKIKKYKLNSQLRNILLLVFLVLLLLSSIVFTYYYTTQQTTQDENSQTITYVEEKNDDEETVTNRYIQEEKDITPETPSTSETDTNANTTTKQNTTNQTTQTNAPTEDQTTPTNTPTDPTPEPEVPETPSAYVVFYSDTQSDTTEEDQNHQRVVNYILATGANPVFHAGDIMEDGTQDSLNRFNTVTTTLRSTRIFYAALGNNDRVVGDSTTPSQLFLDNFTFPNNEKWYSVNYGNLHMVILDSAFSSASQTQINWLIADLQSSNSQNRITGVMFHHPTFSNTISQYLINYGVDFVISGHTHGYTHTVSNGINYFVLSGQPSIGYMKAMVYESRVEITTYNTNNVVIETGEFYKR